MDISSLKNLLEALRELREGIRNEVEPRVIAQLDEAITLLEQCVDEGTASRRRLKKVSALLADVLLKLPAVAALIEMIAS